MRKKEGSATISNKFCHHLRSSPHYLRAACLASQMAAKAVLANGRRFALPRAGAPVVGICLDGNEEAYVMAASAAGKMPHWDRIKAGGSYGLARTVMPTFTNPNNVAIVTGAPPKVNGICGNCTSLSLSRPVLSLSVLCVCACSPFLHPLHRCPHQWRMSGDCMPGL